MWSILLSFQGWQAVFGSNHTIEIDMTRSLPLPYLQNPICKMPAEITDGHRVTRTCRSKGQTHQRWEQGPQEPTRNQSNAYLKDAVVYCLWLELQNLKNAKTMNRIK